MQSSTRFLTILVLLLAGVLGRAAENYAERIAPLIEPDKLATLGDRGANPRIQKCVYWIEMARRDGNNITNLVVAAVDLANYTNRLAAQLTRESLLRNHRIATGYQCLDADGMSEMRQGKSPTIKRGTYKGDQLSVDHIVPRSVSPELDNVIANLELMPLRANSKKKDGVGSRQVQKAEELHRAGLLSKAGLQKVRAAAK